MKTRFRFCFCEFLLFTGLSYRLDKCETGVDQVSGDGVCQRVGKLPNEDGLLLGRDP